MKHICIDVAVDPIARTVRGKVRHDLLVVSPAQTRIRMDQVGLTISGAKVDGSPVGFAVDGDKVELALEKPFRPGQDISVEVEFSVTNPRRGLYFTGPDYQDSSKPHQVWSQGQDEDNRYWFPTFDYPNQKATTEMIATVPAGFTAVSNGALLSREVIADSSRFHYRLGTPHVTYLITLVVAQLSEWEDRGPRGLPVQYFVAPGREEDGRRAFSNTPKMIESFEKVIGVPYAYEKYAQVAVQDFIFGGMENTSATTQTDQTLHDERAHLDFSSDGLVSHELAHQWFGDLVTCRDWSHGWLNEGFATFLQRVWKEADTSENGGEDEAKYSQYLDLKAYLDEDSSHYRRPIVCNTYIEPIDLFDRHLYQKGGLVLNLLRSTLGDELFWKSVRLYLERHRGGSVETLDLIRAIEEVTGRNMRRFFDEWVFGAGHPELEASCSWNDEKKLFEMTVEQKQTGGQAFVEKDGARTHLFHLSPKVVLHFESGESIEHVFELGSVKDRLFVSCPSKPAYVSFDPGFTIPKTIQFPRPIEMLVAQLEKDRDCMGRIQAVQQLRKLSDRRAVEALRKALLQDSFWGVRAEAASALGEIRSAEAAASLVEGLSVPHPKARRAAVQALGLFRDPALAKHLKPMAESDASYFVEADAVHAWAQCLAPSSPKEVLDFARKKAEAKSWRDLVRSGALRAVGEIPGLSRGELPEAVEFLVSATAPRPQMDSRVTAVSLLATIARTATPSVRAQVFECLSKLVEEDHFRMRMGLVAALGASAAPEAIPLLSRIRMLDSDGRVRRDALVASQAISEAGSVPEVVHALKSSLEKLQEEHRKLKDEFELFQGRTTTSIGKEL
jgi:aminopeptidase N